MSCTSAFDTSPLVNAMNTRWTQWDGIASNAVDTTQSLLDDIASQFSSRSLASATYNNVNLPNSLTISADQISITPPTFVAPDPVKDLEIDEIAPVTIGENEFPDAPDPLTVVVPTTPDPVDVTVPSVAPVVSDITLPDAPSIVIPDAPSMTQLTLPTVPVLTFPTFSVAAPEMPALPALPIFSYTDATYTSELEQPLEDKILEWLLGGTGLPEAIWQQIWDKGRSNEEETASKAVQEATEDFAARGFSLPPGALASRIAQARQRVQDAANTINREVAIERAKMEVENIRFAVQQGIELEGQLKNFYNEAARRALEVAKFTMQAAIELRNAVLAQFQAEMEGYRIQIDANNLLIQQELARLEAYKSELEGQRITNEINRLEVEIYSANIQALLANVEVYKGELEGVNAQIEVDKARIDAFISTVEAAGEQIKADSLRFEAYSTQVDAERSKAAIYESQVRAYAATIDAVSQENRVDLANQESAIRVQELKLRQIETDARRFVAELGAEEAETRAYAAQVGAEAAALSANVSVQEVNARNEVEINRLRIADAKNEADVGVANATMFLQNAQTEAALAVTTQQNVANAQAALASSALSAVSMSSSLSGSQSESQSFEKACT